MNFWKSSIKTFIKTQLNCVFCEKYDFIYLIKSLIFSKIQSNNVLLVGGKGVLTPFRRPAPRKSGTFGSFGYKRTFIQNWTLKKYNLNRFISNLHKTKFPSSVTAWHLLHWGEGLKPFRQAYACHLPFQGRLINGNFIIILKIPWQVTVFY